MMWSEEYTPLEVGGIVVKQVQDITFGGANW